MEPTNNIAVAHHQSSPTQIVKFVNTVLNHQNINSGQNSLKSSTVSMASGDHGQHLTITRINDLVRDVDPSVQLDEEVEETLLDIADDFINNIIDGAIMLAKHRHASTIEVKDMQMYLERSFNMWLPGFGTDELRPFKRATLTEAHKQRLALIRRALKKY